MKYAIKIIFALLILLPCFALAAGIGVSPTKLEFNLAEGQTSQQLVVTNPDAKAQAFQIYAEDYPELIFAHPNDFALPPEGSKAVTVSIKAQQLAQGAQTKLDIIAGPLPSKNNFTVAAGVKIPITILAAAPQTLAKKNINWTLIFLCLAGLSLIGYVLLKKSGVRYKN